jgi:aminoglycoside phosphotransferase (APT) family kinase protein
MAERARPVEVDERLLQERVERVVREALGEERSVLALTRSPSEFATVFPADVLHVTLDDGRELRMFLKHLGASDHPEKKRPEKEARIYRELLAGRDLPVPRFYGALWNSDSERHELYLEYIDDWSLKYQPIEHWFSAAAVLADFHVTMAHRDEELARSDVLQPLDTDYFRGYAARARAQLARHSPALIEAFDDALAGYEPAIAALADAVPTLVNSDLSPRNVLADRSRDPVRVCFIDWESAGRGAGVLDIAHLAYGLDGERRKCILDSYFDRLTGTLLDPGSPTARHRLLAAAEAHKAVYRIARCNYRGYAKETVAKLVGLAQSRCDAIGREPGEAWA